LKGFKEELNVPERFVKTDSLVYNCFTIYIAIITKIPLIIVGEPGSSKSASVSIVGEEMVGKYTSNKYFKWA
jgi:E3 ubiquitin-protein ligase RNF213